MLVAVSDNEYRVFGFGVGVHRSLLGSSGKFKVGVEGGGG